MLDARSRQMAALQACMPNAGADFKEALLCHGCRWPRPRLTEPLFRRLGAGQRGDDGGQGRGGYANAACKPNDLRAGNLLYLCHGSR